MLKGGLMELDNLTDTVSVRGKIVEFGGLTIDDMLFLYNSFPHILGVITDAREDRAAAAVGLGPRVMSHVIACALDKRNDEDTLRRAHRLPGPKQLEMFDKIFDLTFEDGASPFVERLMRMAASASRESQEDQASNSEGSWSASLVGDEPRPMRARPRLASSRSGR